MRTDIIDCIGRTPLVRLRVEDDAAAVYAKLELLNPFGMKDRVAKQAILEARRTGVLRDDAPIIESSSGTMALGVALVGTYLGHEVHIVTDPRIDPITLAKLKALGCTVHIVSRMTAHGWQSARLERLEELMEQYPGAFWPRQYDNPANPRAYAALARELLDELGRVDVLIGAVGSGGSLCGTARELRKSNPFLRVVAVDAVGSVIFRQPDRPGRLQGGLVNSLLPANVDDSVVDEVHWLNDHEAFGGTLMLAADEKIFAGNSSGSVYVVARWLRRTVSPSTHITAIFADRGDRYCSTIYSDAYRRERGVDVTAIPTEPREVPYGTAVTSWSFSRLPGTNDAELLAVS
jgi:cysteine synthase